MELYLSHHLEIIFEITEVDRRGNLKAGDKMDVPRFREISGERETKKEVGHGLLSR